MRNVMAGPRWQVNLIKLDPRLSKAFHRHKHRTEYWLVVEGTAVIKQRAVTVAGEEVFGDRTLYEGDIAVIKAAQWHQITNPGKIPLVMVEIWIGSYFGEDDIERATFPQTAGTNLRAKSDR
jgi:mannose-6-phosphate isomerase-like protein (cupin superfamily)